MRLTNALLKCHPVFMGNVIKFKGSALKGKHRFVPPATKGVRYRLWLGWRDELENLKLIGAPYVTVDEELDYLESIGRRHQDVDPLYTSKLEAPMRQHYAVEIMEKFERTRKFENWD